MRLRRAINAFAWMAKRGLPMPRVAYEVIEKLWERAKRIENP
jgi:hypothetical protein